VGATALAPISERAPMPVLRLVRHAQASFGAADYDRLSGLGVQQAELLGERVAACVDVGRLVHGGLRRQHDTARIGVLPATPGDAEVDPDWREFDERDLIERFVPSSQRPPRGAATDPARLRAAIDHAVERWVEQATETGPGSFEAFRGRVRRALAAVWEHAPRTGETVVVTSAGVIAAACLDVQGLDARAWPRLNRVAVNTGVTKIVRGTQGTHLVTFNDHSHLEHARTLITYR
jgi:broad specificity phosphatase PhoE